jgi:intracellular septation protein
MRFFFDLIPVVLFFVAYELGGIYWATGTAMAASVIQIIGLLALKRQVDATAWIGFVVITLFGGLTLWSKEYGLLGIEPTVFIRWKPTVLYWIFSLILLLAPLLLGKNPIKALLGREINLPDRVWTRLNALWGGFFAFLGVLNLYVAFNYPEELWVKFKVFGLMVLMVIFVLGQGVYLAKHMESPHGKS